jgi:hypothetical protein
VLAGDVAVVVSAACGACAVEVPPDASVYGSDLPGGTCSWRNAERIAVTGPRPVVRSRSSSYST